MKKTRIIGALLIILGLITTAYAASVILTQTFPAVTVPGVPTLTSTCNAATLVSSFTADNRIVTFACTASTGSNPNPPAFTASAGTVSYSFTPAPPSGYTTIVLFQTTPPTNGACLSYPGPATGDPTILSPSGGSVTFASSPTTGQLATGAWHYCAYISASATPGSTLAGFAIQWSQ